MTSYWSILSNGNIQYIDLTYTSNYFCVQNQRICRTIRQTKWFKHPFQWISSTILTKQASDRNDRHPTNLSTLLGTHNQDDCFTRTQGHIIFPKVHLRTNYDIRIIRIIPKKKKEKKKKERAHGLYFDLKWLPCVDRHPFEDRIRLY